MSIRYKRGVGIVKHSHAVPLRKGLAMGLNMLKRGRNRINAHLEGPSNAARQRNQRMIRENKKNFGR